MKHFTPYRELREDYGITDYVFYCKQYIGRGAGNLLNTNIQEVRNFVSAVEPQNIMLIGRSSANELSKFPPRVTAAAGLNQWRKASDTGSGYSHTNCTEFIAETEPEILRNTGVAQQNLGEC